MKKPNRTKLTFNREVVRTLDVAELGGVVGGETTGGDWTFTRAEALSKQDGK